MGQQLTHMLKTVNLHTKTRQRTYEHKISIQTKNTHTYEKQSTYIRK